MLRVPHPVFRVRHGSSSLGTVTMVPVLAVLSWILGTVYLLEIPYNSETAIITGIAIGIGVDFAIHVSERFVQERARSEPIAALSATVIGTGGALLASAATTVAGFGILALSLVPSLQCFGIVTGLTTAFAWVASVLVLPSLLVLWDRVGSRERSAGTGERERCSSLETAAQAARSFVIPSSRSIRSSTGGCVAGRHSSARPSRPSAR